MGEGDNTLRMIEKEAAKISKLTKEERREMMLEMETRADFLLERGMITQEQAWDMYFGLLHECDESHFFQDRPRILAKIDQKRYKPFQSKNPGIVMLARIRMAGAEVVH